MKPQRDIAKKSSFEKQRLVRLAITTFLLLGHQLYSQPLPPVFRVFDIQSSSETGIARETIDRFLSDATSIADLEGLLNLAFPSNPRKIRGKLTVYGRIHGLISLIEFEIMPISNRPIRLKKNSGRVRERGYLGNYIRTLDQLVPSGNLKARATELRDTLLVFDELKYDLSAQIVKRWTDLLIVNDRIGWAGEKMKSNSGKGISDVITFAQHRIPDYIGDSDLYELYFIVNGENNRATKKDSVSFSSRNIIYSVPIRFADQSVLYTVNRLRDYLEGDESLSRTEKVDLLCEYLRMNYGEPLRTPVLEHKLGIR